MRNPALLFLLLLTTVTAFLACRRNKGQCSVKNPQIIFVNYSLEQSDTLIIRRYSNNNQFSSLLDTVLFVRNKITRTLVGQDSVILSVPYPSFSESLGAYNWEIAMPGLGNVARIYSSVISLQQEEQSGTECHSFLSSITVNDRTYSFNTWFGNQYRVFVTR